MSKKEHPGLFGEGDENPFTLTPPPATVVTADVKPINHQKDKQVRAAGLAQMQSMFKTTREQVILGQIPSKSNCYKIIILKQKPRPCDKCKGYVTVPACDACGGKGEIEQEPHASLAKSSALKKYEQDFFIQCNKYRDKMLAGYFQIEVDVFYPNQRSDLDNSLKVLLDCLQMIKAFPNDNKCTRIEANKFLDAQNPRIEFTIKTAMNNNI